MEALLDLMMPLCNDTLLLETMFNVARDGIVFHELSDDPAVCRFLEANPAVCQLLGYTRQEMLQLCPIQIQVPEQRNAIPVELSRIATEGKLLFEKTLMRKDGSTFPAEIHASTVSRHGRPHVVSIIRDISNRKEIEQQLRRNHQTFYSLIQNNPFGVYLVDADFRLREVSLGAQKVFQHVRPLLGRDFAEVLRCIWTEPFATQAIELFRHTLDTGEPYSAPRTVERRHDTAETEAYDWRIERITLPDGRFGVVCYFYDLSERQRWETAVRESEEKYRSLFDNMSEGFAVGEVLCDGSGKPYDFCFVEMNQSFEKQSGLTRDILRKPMKQVLPSLEQHWVDHYCQVAVTGKPIHFDAPNLDTGRHYDVFCYSPASGRFAIIFTDVTQRKQAEEALRAGEHRLRLALESGRMGTWDWDVATDRIKWSEGHYTLLGYKPGEVPATHEAFRCRVHPEDRPRQEREVSLSMQQRRDYSCEFRVLWPDNSVHWLSARGRYVYKNGQAVRMHGVLTDIDQSKQAEAELLRAKETAEAASKAKDQFIAVLSHELRTPLTPVVAALSLLRADDRIPADVQDDLEMISRNLDLEVRLIADLLDVSRIVSGKLHLEKRPIDVLLTLREAARIVAEDLVAKQQILSIELPEEACLALADAARLQQVFWNLLRNASKFSPPGSQIILRAQILPATTAASPLLQVDVTDPGAGISAEVLPTLFKAFEQGDKARAFGGLGLGLSICKAVVEMHCGTISARSEGPSRGATFTVCLPLTAPPLPKPAPAVP